MNTYSARGERCYLRLMAVVVYFHTLSKLGNILVRLSAVRWKLSNLTAWGCVNEINADTIISTLPLV